MANDVFRAIDASLVIGVDDASSPEGAAADGLVSQYDLSNAVGRLRNVQVTISSDVRPFYEIGRRYPTHLRPGVIRISGTADRAHVNGALLRLLLGDGAVSPPPAPNFIQPSFNIITALTNPARPDQSTKVTIFGVKFDTWSYTIPAEDFVMEGVKFQAMRIGFEEELTVRTMTTRLLTTDDLLLGSKAAHEVTIPAAILRPQAPAGDAQPGHVRMRPLTIAVLTLISRAAREDASLIPLLMIKEAVVEPVLTLEQIRQMHVGLVHFLVSQINRISGLDANGATLDEAADSPLGRTHLLLAKHFGWTPDQVSQLTPGQVAVYLAGIEKLLQFDQGHP